MPLSEEHIPFLYAAYRERFSGRDERMEILDAVVRGDFDEVDPDNDKITSRSPNLIQVALEDTAEAAGSMPTIRVAPRRPTSTIKKQAEKMERIASGYFDFSQMELLVPQTVMDMAAFGFAAWVVWPDFGERLPVIEKRDPRTCYPEPGFRPGQQANRVMFVRELFFSQLPAEYQAKLVDFARDRDDCSMEERLKVKLVEYFDTEEYVISALIEADSSGTLLQRMSGQLIPVVLDRLENKIGVCPVVIGSRFSLDGEFRGQFDQVIGVLEAHVRLMAMVLDYADQSVYSDIWVKDLIGELSWGGGAYIELGPQGAIGRVPPAVTSLNIQQDLHNLVEGIHVGGRWPKSRPGQVDQAIASAKFVEATAGMMNTAIKTYHQLLQRMMEHALRVCFLTDQNFFPGPKSVSGILRNQEFVEEYDATKDIDPKNRVRVEYGLGLGRDPAQSAVLMLQYADKDYISDEFVQENIDGLTDVGRERVRIDTEKFRSMLLAKLLQGIEQGSIPDKALVEIMESRAKGEDLASLYRKYVVEPQEQPAPGADPMAALVGGPAGAPGAPGPGGAPGAPPLMPPPPPDASKMLARLNVPLGGGSLIGSQVG